MSVSALLVLSAYCLVCSIADLSTRRISNLLTCTGMAEGLLGSWLGWWEWSWVGSILSMMPLFAARVPAGDIKGMLVVGGFLGPLVFAVEAMALTVSYGLWWGHRKGYVPFVGDWPFFPLLAGSTGVILWVTWG